MRNPWLAKAAEFHARAAETGDSFARDKFEMIALAFAKAGDFRQRADDESNPYFRGEFEHIAAGYAKLASEGAASSANGDDFPHRNAKGR